MIGRSKTYLTFNISGISSLDDVTITDASLVMPVDGIDGTSRDYDGSTCQDSWTMEIPLQWRTRLPEGIL